MGHMSLQNTMALRGGKELSQAYRETTIMQDFASDEEDEEYEDVDEVSDNDDVSDDDDEEEEDELDSEEVKDTLLNSGTFILLIVAQVIGEQGLLNKNKVLRHGKEIQSGEVGDLTDQIKQVLFKYKY
jgi:hypothetical protein